MLKISCRFSGNGPGEDGSPLGWSLVAGFPPSWNFALPYLAAILVFSQKHDNRGMSTASPDMIFLISAAFLTCHSMCAVQP